MQFEICYRENNNSQPITYELTIGPDNINRPCVISERLRQSVDNREYVLTFLSLVDGKGFAYIGNEGGQDDETGNAVGEKIEIELSDTKKLGIVTLGEFKQYERINKFLRFLKSCFLCYFSPASARQVQTTAPAPYLNRIGSNLNNVAQYMYRENPKKFAEVLSEIQDKIPNITRIAPKEMPNKQIVLEFYQKGFEKPFYSNRMSDGTLKLFAYYMLMNENNPRQLVFIEEPENGLYHQYLSDLAIDLANSVGTGFSKQIFVTTHSPFFVNALRPDQIWVLEKDKTGFSVIKNATDYDFVKEMVEEGAYLGDLWNSKFFG